MLRETVVQGLDHEPDFSWRGENVTRIENLSDIVFAIALGMLVSAASVPRTFDDLGYHLLSIVPVAMGFAVMLAVWNTHFTYFRRYGLGDRPTIFLNAVLLLLVLVIAYPLRFIFDSLFGYVMAMFGHPARIIAMEVGYAEAGTIMGYFAGGFGAIMLVFALMYAHALRRGDDLGLSANERRLTRISVVRSASTVVIAVGVVLLATQTEFGAFSGFLLLLNNPCTWIIQFLFRPRRKKSPPDNGATQVTE